MTEPPPPAGPPAPDPAQAARVVESRRDERRALGVLAVIAFAGMVWIARPVGVGLLLGMLIAFSLQPFYEQLAERSGRPALTALGFLVVSTLGLLATLGGLSSLLIARGLVVAQALIASLAPGGALRETAERLSARLGPLQLAPDELTSRLHAAAADLAARAAGIAAALATMTFDVILTLFFAMMTLVFVLRRWVEIARLLEDLLPLRPRYTRALLQELQRVGRSTLLGTVLTGLAQGVFAALGYWICGVPEPAFFGAATAVASLLPGVGTLLVWVPAGIFLLVTGHPGSGVLELIWGGLVVVGMSDYVVRPRLIGRGTTMPALLTFTALFGGLEVFGLAGLLVGPLIMSVSFSVLRIFAQDGEERRALGERHAS